MARLIWTERGVSSLEDVYDYIAADSPTYAKFQVERITENIENLKAFPESGRKLPEYPAGPYREIIVDNYRLIYRYDATKQSVIVINIVHGRRSLVGSMITEKP